MRVAEAKQKILEEEIRDSAQRCKLEMERIQKDKKDKKILEKMKEEEESKKSCWTKIKEKYWN